MERIARLTTATLTMGAILAVLMPNYAFAAQVSFNDAAIKATYEKFPSPQGHGEGRGYLVVPAALTAKGPAVLVVHENRGLNPYIMDVARRLAKAGFVAFAPHFTRQEAILGMTMTAEPCRRSWIEPGSSTILWPPRSFSTNTRA